jgi:soluble lytic murein transglycosylase-like protein
VDVRDARTTFWLTVAFLLAVALLAFAATPSAAAEIPRAAKAHERELTRLAYAEFGLDAPVALFAAQIHQESSWRSRVSSRYADGLAQFTPATADWIAEIYPDLGEAAPFSPGWAMRALLRYDRHLLGRMQPWVADVPEVDAPAALPRCDRWAFALSAYNGGPGWIPRDRAAAAAAGADPNRWWGEVEQHSQRAEWAFRENRGYPRRVLLELEPRYLAAGWRGRPTC